MHSWLGRNNLYDQEALIDMQEVHPLLWGTLVGRGTVPGSAYAIHAQVEAYPRMTQMTH